MSLNSLKNSPKDIVHALEETKKLADKLLKKRKFNEERAEHDRTPRIIIGERTVKGDVTRVKPPPRPAPLPPMSPFERAHDKGYSKDSDD